MGSVGKSIYNRFLKKYIIKTKIDKKYLKKTETREKSFWKTSFQVGMDLHKVQKQGWKKHTRRLPTLHMYM